MSASARDLYLASLDATSELNVRRLAEMSRVPGDDPMWLIMYELQRSAREITSGAGAALANDAFAQRLSNAIGSNVAQNVGVLAALTAAVDSTRDAATRAIRSLEVSLRDVARRRAAAPFASLAFAFALGLTVCSTLIWGAFHVGMDYGYTIGYLSGYHDGTNSLGNHK